MARGAAALGTNGQHGCDAVYPYLYHGSTRLDVEKVGLIIIRVTKSDFSANSQDKGFQRKLTVVPGVSIGIKRCAIPRPKAKGRFSHPMISSAQEPIQTFSFLSNGTPQCGEALIERADPWMGINFMINAMNPTYDVHNIPGSPFDAARLVSV